MYINVILYTEYLLDLLILTITFHIKYDFKLYYELIYKSNQFKILYIFYLIIYDKISILYTLHSTLYCIVYIA